jgi:hypothetical protein
VAMITIGVSFFLSKRPKREGKEAFSDKKAFSAREVFAGRSQKLRIRTNKTKKRSKEIVNLNLIDNIVQ